MPPPRELPVPEDEEGTRLETFLRRRFGLARDTALKALRKGWIRVDGKRARGDRRLAPGEVVKVTNYAIPLPALEGGVPAERVDLPVGAAEEAAASLRLADAALLVSAKPAGVVVHRGSGHPWGWADALALLEGGEPGFPPTPIGRLDRDTSGLLVLARSRASARALFEQLRSRELARTYQALVLGAPAGAEGTIELALKKRRSGRVKMVADPEGAPARTHWRLLRRLGPAALLALELDTGRTHQIRAQLAALGHPLLGDPRYANEAARELAARLGLARLFLHAGQLRLTHPVDGRALAFDEPLPSELAAPLARLGY